MAEIPFFGVAINAVLPYLQNGGDPMLIRKKSFYDEILRPGWIREQPLLRDFVYSPEAKEYIRRCWDYVALIPQHARSITYEPLMDNGRRPDMVARGKVDSFVIDLKGFSYRALDDKKVQTLRSQIMGSAQILQRKVTNGSRVKGFMLAFVNTLNPDDFNPMWLQLEPFEGEDTLGVPPEFMQHIDLKWPYLQR